eukprot:CAMPEP_0182914242 /NCGR_PEP_ID=MMETSP0034_2-20130328/38473_1 /TAXON_ID=156128 /ORGANISM="Nephroselmis pyriformis, Strain CCMP717" /LENGTH=437 /DNA_ID=CAMNT_0025051017 /DNA_START=100 /DNA_END=1409 /DNA_ORIENTATION=+
MQPRGGKEGKEGLPLALTQYLDVEVIALLSTCGADARRETCHGGSAEPLRRPKMTKGGPRRYPGGLLSGEQACLLADVFLTLERTEGGGAASTTYSDPSIVAILGSVKAAAHSSRHFHCKHEVDTISPQDTSETPAAADGAMLHALAKMAAETDDPGVQELARAAQAQLELDARGGGSAEERQTRVAGLMSSVAMMKGRAGVSVAVAQLASAADAHLERQAAAAAAAAPGDAPAAADGAMLHALAKMAAETDDPGVQELARAAQAQLELDARGGGSAEERQTRVAGLMSSVAMMKGRAGVSVAVAQLANAADAHLERQAAAADAHPVPVALSPLAKVSGSPGSGSTDDGALLFALVRLASEASDPRVQELATAAQAQIELDARGLGTPQEREQRVAGLLSSLAMMRGRRNLSAALEELAEYAESELEELWARFGARG